MYFMHQFQFAYIFYFLIFNFQPNQLMLDWLFGRKKQEQPPKQQQKKKKKSKKQAQAEDKWMYEFLVQFLCSPIWKVSVLDFVDNKCIVFDNQEENKFQYTTIHKEFKELVGTLFDGMMQEIGLTQDKLAQLLERGLQSKQRKIFNQLLLCDDFSRFKDLMLKRNKSLQQQAMKELQQSKSGIKHKPTQHQQQKQIVRQSQIAQKQRLKKLQEQEDQVLRKVLEMSMLQAKQQEAISKLEQKTEEYEVSKISKISQENANMNKKSILQEKIQQKPEPVKQQQKKVPAKLQALKKPKLDSIESNTKHSQLSDLPPLKQSHLSDLPPVKNNFKQQEPQVKAQIVKQQPKVQVQVEQKKQQLEQFHPPVQTQDDRKRRLLEQRQKIRRKKQEQRRKQMEQEQKQKQHTHHQNVHTVVLQEDGIHQSRIGVKQEQNKDKVSQDEIKRRKELMLKIKNRIVDDF